MPFFTLEHYYEVGSALSNPTPPECQTIQLSDMSCGIITRLEKRKPVYFGTVTLDPSKFGMYDRESQTELIELYMRRYCKTMSPDDILIYVLEYHKDHRPHIHMLSTGYVKNFKDTFKKLGSRNSHSASYQKTINPLKVFAYLCKFDPIYSKVKGAKTIKIIDNTITEYSDIIVSYNSTPHPMNGYTYTPRCAWLPPSEE